MPRPLELQADSGGQFSLSTPGGGVVILNARANGYEPAQQRVDVGSQSSLTIEITLERLAQIHGRLINDETRKPIAGAKLALVRTEFTIRGQEDPATARNAVTSGNDGSFAFVDLAHDAQYRLRIESPPTPVFQEIPAKDLTEPNREKALKVPEPADGYGIVMWPSDETGGTPIQITSDAVDLGDIPLRRSKLHNYSGVLGGCTEGASLQVLALAKNGRGTIRIADLDTACGNGFRLLNLPEGTFSVVAQGGPPRQFVSQTIDPYTRGPVFMNVSPAVAVQITVEVEGVQPDNFPDDIKRINITLTPESAPVSIDAPDTISPSEYEAHVFGGERYRLSVVPPPNYYLKQVSYNGVSSDNAASFTAVSAALSTLRLVLSNHPGAVEVQAPPNTVVYLVKEGTEPDLALALGRTIQPSGAAGRARFSGLSPGTYRAFLLNASEVASPETIVDGMKRGTSVTVEVGQTTSVALTAP